ncbi:hypothetical protein FIBSPDRAFT_902889 [Athelia psychrophila]|uniref:Uncharacterized protein n=1 Tax=Athelia psychrophila TaxID=1759441 RepID=A0A167WNT8_9AGAM|nr:hypothetical protein FIBSPDRAFT_902889 [Fibularhizoctonia sp. CBS 109695]
MCMGQVGGILVPVGLFALAFAAYTSVPWIFQIPTIASIPTRDCLEELCAQTAAGSRGSNVGRALELYLENPAGRVSWWCSNFPMGNASKFDKAAHVIWPMSADVHAGGCIHEIRHPLSCHARWRRAQTALLLPQRALPSRQTNASFRGASVTSITEFAFVDDRSEIC